MAQSAAYNCGITKRERWKKTRCFVGDESQVEIHWPELAPRYADALKAAVEAVLAHYSPVGIIAGGSILRGQGGPTSDIDMYVIHQAPFRQRLQRIYNGVPFEIFVNPPQQVQRYFAEENQAARPITAHLLSTGMVLLDRDPVVAALRAEAAQWLATPPNPSPESLRFQRYMIVDLLDNARDLVQSDAANTDLLLHQVAQSLVEYTFRAANRPLPRLKQMLSALAEVDAAGASLAQRYYAAKSTEVRLIVAERWARHLLGVTGFFEWDSEPDPVSIETNSGKTNP